LDQIEIAGAYVHEGRARRQFGSRPRGTARYRTPPAAAHTLCLSPHSTPSAPVRHMRPYLPDDAAIFSLDAMADTVGSPDQSPLLSRSTEFPPRNFSFFFRDGRRVCTRGWSRRITGQATELAKSASG